MTAGRACRNIRDMICEPTVLILGAGASEPYGLPLGEQLVDDILQNLFDAPDNALRMVLRKLEYRDGDVETFREKLDGSGALSIDEFLEGNAGVYVEIGKVAIADTVLRKENRDKLLGRDKAKVHWYRYIWRKMRLNANRDNFEEENGLDIVTFNYDRSFEYYFTTLIENSFDIQRWEDASSLFQRSVQVVHVHGCVGEAKNFASPSPRKSPYPETIRGAADSIRVVHDPIAQDNPQFIQARDLISNASCVAFIGFGYHPANCTRLNLQQCLPKAIRQQGGPFASALKMGKAEIELAREALGVPNARFADTGLDALQFLREFLPLR